MEYNVAIKKDRNNLIRLKKVKNEEERSRIYIAFIYLPDKQVPKKARKMLELINQERKILGLQPEFIRE